MSANRKQYSAEELDRIVTGALNRNLVAREKVEQLSLVPTSETPVARAVISPELANLYARWEEITPGCSNRPGVQEVRAMVANKEISLSVPSAWSDRPVKGRVTF